MTTLDDLAEADRYDEARELDGDALRCAVCGGPKSALEPECFDCWVDADDMFRRKQDV